MFINDEDNWDEGEYMHSDALQHHGSGEYYKYPRKTRGPRFAIFLLIIIAILALVLAFSVAFLWITAPNITFSKDANVDNADPGDIIVYKLSYENLGSVNVKNVAIRDILPVNVTFVSSDPEYDNVSGKTYTWYIGTVTPGERGNITITVIVNAGEDKGVSIYNYATFDYNDDKGNRYDQIKDDAETFIKL